VELNLVRDWHLVLGVDEILRGQGSDPTVIRQRRPMLVAAAEWALERGLPLIQPAVLEVEVAVQGLHHERLALEGGVKLSGALLAQHLAGAERVVLMLCTLGPQLEQLAAEVLAGDPVLGLALDGLGTAAIESLAAAASSACEARARRAGLNASIPLSPGMVGWTVAEGQPQIMALLDPSLLGVRLTSSYMMHPVKTITQVIGIGAALNSQGRTCDFCSLKETCRYQDHYR
jgi:hypothetical protein